MPNPELRRTLDPDPESMRRLGYALVDRVVEHLSTLSDQPVGRRGTRADFARLVDEPLPQEPTSLESCLDFFFDRVVPGMTRVNHPRFHGHIPCPSSFASAMGEMLAAGTNPFVGSWLGGATVSSLELTTLRWIAQMLGYDEQAAGIFTSGGSMANLVGLASARARGGADALQRGVVYVSREGHTSVNKAAAILGFPPQAVRTIEADAQCRMDVEQLCRAIDADRAAGRLPLFVAANAGTTNTGAVDRLEPIAQLAADQGLWLHVDGAYGGFAALTSAGRELLRGMERADSLALDPHKWLYCAMGVGCVLVRDTACLESAFGATGSYLKDLPSDEVNFMDRGPELSRPARVLAVWMLIRSAGRQALAEQIEQDMRLARLAARLLAEDARLDVQPPQLSIVTFRHCPREGESEQQRARRDTALMESTLAEGRLMLSTTLLQQRSTLRLAVMNHRTTEDDIRLSVREIRRHAT